MWKAFWFEGNEFFGQVDSPETWEKVKASYLKHAGTSTEEVLRARVCPSSAKPKYGFALECSGKQTLREFFDENGMTP